MYNSEETGKQWDKNLRARIQDIESGNDVVYLNTVVPNVTEQVCKFSKSISILDIGCLYGHLTNKIAKTHPNIIGIDVAEKAIQYGTRKYPNIKLFHYDIFALNTKNEYDLCLATMVVHNLEPLSSFFEKVYSLLVDNGYFLVVALHPYVWAKERIESFDYKKECQYKIPFRVRSGINYPEPLTYYHRTLDTYLKEAIDKKFSIIDYTELYKRNEPAPHNLLLLLKKGDVKESMDRHEVSKIITKTVNKNLK